MKEVHGVQLSEGLVLGFWDMGKAQGLRPKDKLVELHMKLVEVKELVLQRFGQASNCLGVNQRLYDIFEVVPSKKWTVKLESLDADQILVGKQTGDESPVYYYCITIYNLEQI